MYAPWICLYEDQQKQLMWKSTRTTHMEIHEVSLLSVRLINPEIIETLTNLIFLDIKISYIKKMSDKILFSESK